MIRATILLTAPVLITLAACAQAPSEPTALAEGNWSVDPAASSLSYVSVKSGEVAEANSFTGLSGSVAADGTASVDIDLSTVNTGVDIRNERMRDIFFDVANHPTATVTAKIDPAAFATLAVGETIVQPLDAKLTVKGVEAPITTQVSVTRIADNRVLATSTQPVIVYADALKLTEGLAQLQELAGLPSITPAVPVTFSIAFQR